MVTLLALSLLLLAPIPVAAQQGEVELPTLEFRVGLEPDDPGYEEGEELPFRGPELTARVGPPRFFHIERAGPGQDVYGYPAIQCRISREDEKAFHDWTAGIVDRQLAIVVDGEILTMPVLNSALGRSFIIQGRFTEEEVLKLVARLGGSLPEPFPFFIRVLRGEDGMPLEHARAELDGGEFMDRTDEAGLVEVPVRFVHSEQVTVEARGRSTAHVFVSKAHQTPERAITVDLHRTCTIEGRVLEADGSPLAQAYVRLITPKRHACHPPWAGWMWFWFPEEWEALIDYGGEYTIHGLPAGAPLRVEIVSTAIPADERLPSTSPDPGSWEEGVVLWSSEGCLVFSPSESRKLDWTLPPRFDLGGVLVDQDGTPVGDQEVWVVRPAEPVAQPEVLGWYHVPIARARTSSTGAFRFLDVPRGTALVGPAPPAHGESPDPEKDVACVAMPVELKPRKPGDELVLRTGRGLTIRGEVLGPDGRPLAGAQVVARPEPGAGWIEAETDEQGAFEVGPLAPGRYRVGAVRGPSSDWPHHAVYEAGEGKAIVRVAPSSSLEGRIEDPAGGSPTQAVVHVMCRESPWPAGRTSEADWGTFSTHDLGAGTYDVTAVTAGGRVGVLEGLRVPAGEAIGGLVVELEEGARLRVNMDGECRRHLLAVRRGEAFVGGDQIFGGVPSVLLLPPGKLRVLLYDWDGVVPFEAEALAEQEVVLEAGQEKEISFRIR